MLKIDALSYALKGKSLLKNITACAQPGTFIALLGDNGAGKTTLLRCISGFYLPTQGTACLGSQNLAALLPHERTQFCQFFSSENSVIWGRSVQELLTLSTGNPAPYLAPLGLEDFLTRPFHQLSSGQRQRVLLAIALASPAPLLLLDEPLTHLDHRFQYQVVHLLKTEAKKGKTLLASLHHLDLAKQLCDEAWILEEGSIIHSGPLTEETLNTLR